MSSNDEPNYQVAKSESAPWAAQQPYLNTGFATAQNLLTSGAPQFFPNATYVPMSGATGASLTGAENAATGMWNANNTGTLMGLTPAAMENTLATVRGDYLNRDNPHFTEMLNRTYQKAQPTIDASFASAGRGISGAGDAAKADAWANIAGNLGYQNYATERQNQMAATAAAPGMVMAGMDPLKQLGQVGAAREGYAGQEVQDQMARWNAGQNQGWNNLAKYMAAVAGGSFGSQGSQYIPQTSNPWLTAAGLGASGVSMLGTLFGRNGVFPRGA